MKQFNGLLGLFLFLYSVRIDAQYNPTTNLDGINHSSGTYLYSYYGDIVSPSNSSSPSQISADAKVEFKATNSIFLKPGFSVLGLNPSTGGNFYGHIQAPPFQVAFIHSNSSLHTVGKYQKLEIGIDYPQITSQINTFLNDLTGTYKPGTSSYNTAFANGTVINPYDPDHISVEATFYKPGSAVGTSIRYGFYYKKFDLPQSATDWVEKSDNPASPNYDPEAAYEWRVRFAPDKIGVWNVEVKIYIGASLIGSSGLFSFNVAPSGEKGIVQVAANNQYLYFSETSDPFVPIGDNIGSTKIQGWVNPCSTSNCNGAGNNSTSDRRMQADAYQEFTNYINVLTAGGGNTTRLQMMPMGLNIEYEKLCNYSTRDIEMWELDRFIGYVEQKDVFLMLAQSASELNVASGAYQNDPNASGGTPVINQNWDWNPYRDQYTYCTLKKRPGYASPPGKQFKGIAGVVNPQDFFKNPTAMSFFKKRLRYIESRWGYSPHVYMHEFLQEIDGLLGGTEGGVGVGQTPNIGSDYWQTSDPNDSHTLNNDVAYWYDYMGDYLRNTLKSRALITGSYLNFSRWDDPTFSRDFTTLFTSGNIDVIQSHAYPTREAGNKSLMEDIQNAKNFPGAAAPWLAPLPNKPILVGELDNGQYVRLGLCSDRSWHNQMWSSSFFGTFGPGLLWSPFDILSKIGGYNPPSPSTVYTGEYNQNYNAVKTFLSGSDFLNNKYEPHSTHCLTPGCTENNRKFEIFYMIGKQNQTVKEIIGWFHNRSYNLFTDQACQHTYSDIYVSYTSTSIAQIIPIDPWVAEQVPQMVYGADLSPPYICGSGTKFNTASSGSEFDYIASFGWGPVQPGVCANPGTYSYPIYPQPTQTITLPNVVSPGDNCVVEWYWTWGLTSGGQVNSAYTQVVSADISGNLTFSSPPTGQQLTGADYPGDWAFRITNTSGQKQIAPSLSKSVEQKDISFSVYPNPNTGVFRITRHSSNPCNLKIVDLLGRTVFENDNCTDAIINVDLHTVQPGVYIVRFQSPDGKIETERMIKQ